MEDLLGLCFSNSLLLVFSHNSNRSGIFPIPLCIRTSYLRIGDGKAGMGPDLIPTCRDKS